MLLNTVEFLSMNNPLRAFIQNVYELPKLRQMTTLKNNIAVLEVGCGNGTGTKLISKYFNPNHIDAIDLDPRMIEIARERNSNNKIHFQVANATKLPFANNSFDAVFDFGIIHHIPNWKVAIREISRVLKPSGQAIIEDLSKETFGTTLGKFLRSILRHPYEQMYTKHEFLDSLKKEGLKIIGEHSYYPLYTLKYFTVVAEKLLSNSN